MDKKQIKPILQALLAAVLFGASSPLSKLLLGEIDPITLAAFLYLGSGLGLLAVKSVLGISNKTRGEKESPLKKTDIKWLAGAILAGGVLAPIILLFGLQDTPGATASLLLNFESVATTLIAALAFKEAVSRRAWVAIITITVASILLSLNPGQNWGFSPGALGVLAACILWGADNNFTRNISGKDPLTITTLKGLLAGSFSLLLTLLLGNQLPSLGVLFRAMVLGSLSYGLSIVLFIHALRALGAARTSALYGTAPLAGMVLSFLILQESIGAKFLIALPLMALGTLFLVYEKHIHTHVHAPTTHEHWHHHKDEHHAHQHQEGWEVPAHAHAHDHSPLEHKHHHMPDLHHRHLHSA